MTDPMFHNVKFRVKQIPGIQKSQLEDLHRKLTLIADWSSVLQWASKIHFR